MKPSKSIIQVAKEQASMSLSRFRVGAVVFYKGTVVGEGYNDSIKTHPKSPHPYKVIDAEFAAVIDAIRSLGGHGYERFMLKDCGIYVHRLLKDGSAGNSKPCSFCQQMLEWTGIKKEEIYYSV